MPPRRSVSFCVHHHCKCNQLISFKPGVVIGPTNQQNWWLSGSGSVYCITCLLPSPLRNRGF